MKDENNFLGNEILKMLRTKYKLMQRENVLVQTSSQFVHSRYVLQ